ncbi:MAG: hypothetical protein ACD_39C01157G0006 [uncultured bacterium]|nr:MAG: hypothetical protein ACD_39C01157G0006 [uncultured bacterium]
MNNLGTNLVALLIVLIVVFSVGRLVLLADAQKQLDHAQSELVQYQTNQKTLDAEYESLKSQVKNTDVPVRSNKLVLPGQEASLLRSILDLGGKSLRLNSYSMLPSFRAKAADESMFTENPAENFGATEELPQLDDQGMPVGLAAESDEEWPGVEIIPVKLTFTSTYRSFGKFLSEVGKGMPISAVRSMDLLLKSEGIVKGTLIMNFPVAEAHK